MKIYNLKETEETAFGKFTKTHKMVEVKELLKVIPDLMTDIRVKCQSLTLHQAQLIMDIIQRKFNEELKVK